MILLAFVLINLRHGRHTLPNTWHCILNIPLPLETDKTPPRITKDQEKNMLLELIHGVKRYKTRSVLSPNSRSGPTYTTLNHPLLHPGAFHFTRGTKGN
jgi:hypothetical protein